MVRKRKQFTPQSNFVINGRSVVHQGSGATVTSTSINYTGKKKKPVAYTNVAKSEDLVDGCDSFTVNGNPVALIDSKISKSSGDEAGDGGGIYSGTVNGECTFLTGSIEVTAARSNGVLVNGKAIVRHGDLAISNSGNCPPTPIEQAPADSPAIQQHTYKLAPPEEPSDYSLSIMIHGPNNFVRNSFIGLWHQDEANDGQWQDFWMQSIDNEANSQLFGNTRRLSFHNLPPEKTMLSIERYSVDGEHFMIPLDYAIARPYERCGTPSVMTVYHDEETYLLQTQFVSQLGKEGDKDWQNNFAHSPEDFSDIWRLSSHTRQLVYDFLIHYQLSPEQALLASERKAYKDSPKPNQSIYTYREYGDGSNIESLTALKKSWYQLLPPELKGIVDTELTGRKPLNPGWLYLYANGFLWREIRIDEAGQYSDVDLARYAGETLRLATGMADNAVILPYRVNNTPIELEVLYCPEQLSWDRINYFGGMDPHDKRLIHSHIEPWHSDKSKAKQARAKYLMPLDLKPAVKQFTMPLANVKKKYGLSLFETLDRIPVIPLPEPLAIVNHATDDIHRLYQELHATARALMKHDNNEYFLSALMTYRYFFDKRIDKAEQASEEAFKKRIQRPKSFVEAKQVETFIRNPGFVKKENVFYNNRKNFDLERLENDLQVARRQRIRELIFMLQKNLVSFVSEQDSANNKLAQSQASSFSEQLSHLFSRRLPQLEPAVKLLDGLIASIKIKGSGADANLSTDDDEFDYTPIHHYLAGLMQVDNTVMSYVLPTNDKAFEFDKWKLFNWKFDHIKNPRPTPQMQKEEFAYLWNAVDNDTQNSTITSIWQSIFNILKNCVEGAAKIKLSDEKSSPFSSEGVKTFVSRIVTNANELKSQEAGLQQGKVDTQANTQMRQKIIGFDESAWQSQADVVSIDYANEVKQLKVAGASRFTHEIITTEKLHPKLRSKVIQADSKQLLSTYQSIPNESTLYTQIKQAQVFGKENSKLHGPQTKEFINRLTNQEDLWNINFEAYHKEFSPSPARTKPITKSEIANSGFTSLMVICTWANMLAVFEENKQNQSATGWDDLAVIKCLLQSLYSLEILAESIVSKEMVKDFQQEFIRTGSLWSALRTEVDEINIASKSAGHESFANMFKHLNNSPMKFVGLLGAGLNIVVSLRDVYASFNKHDIAGASLRSGSLLVAGADLTSIGSLIAENYIQRQVDVRYAAILTEKLAQGYTKEAIKRLALNEILLEVSPAVSLLGDTLAPIFTNPWVGVGVLIAGIIFTLSYEALKDTKLEKWTKNSPYSKSPDREQIDFNYVAELEECLNKPSLSLQKSGKDHTRLSFNLINYDPTRHKLEIEIELILLETLRNEKFASMASHKFPKKSIKITPLKEELHFNNKHSLPKIDYYVEHNLEQLSKESNIPQYALSIEIVVKYRLVNDDNTFFPLVKENGVYLGHNNVIQTPQLNNDDKTWFIQSYNL